MKQKSLWMFAFVCTLAMLAASAAPASAQDQTKEKPPMYTYIANWAIPRAQWAQMDKDAAANQAMLEKLVADGTLVGFGSDINEVHEADGGTHDTWWSSMTMAGILNTLDRLKTASADLPALGSATKHWDEIAITRHYNWRPGSYKGAYTRGAEYQLKPDAPADAIDVLSVNLFVPLFEKLLADGTILEYEIDTQAIHTDNPLKFTVLFITPNAEGMDKFDTALRAALKANPLGTPAFTSMVDFSAHRDELARSIGVYK